MDEVNWLDMLGWEENQLEDLRFVGYSYLKQGHYDIALKFFEALVVLSKNAPYDLQILGALYLEKGDNLAALNYFEKALKLQPQHLYTQLNRSKALFALGYKRQALESAKALKSCADRDVASQAEALILAYT